MRELSWNGCVVLRAGVGQVDGVENIWAAEAGDLHSAHPPRQATTVRLA
jgi:hypothetical protein